MIKCIFGVLFPYRYLRRIICQRTNVILRTYPKTSNFQSNIFPLFSVQRSTMFPNNKAIYHLCQILRNNQDHGYAFDAHKVNRYYRLLTRERSRIHARTDVFEHICPRDISHVTFLFSIKRAPRSGSHFFTSHVIRRVRIMFPKI